MVVSYAGRGISAGPTTTSPSGHTRRGCAAGDAAAIHEPTNAQLFREVEWNVRAEAKSWIWTSLAPRRFVPPMPEDEEMRRDIIRRLFYLITVAAEDAATMAVEGQSRAFPIADGSGTAAGLGALGEAIQILAAAIEILEKGGSAHRQSGRDRQYRGRAETAAPSASAATRRR